LKPVNYPLPCIDQESIWLWSLQWLTNQTMVPGNPWIFVLVTSSNVYELVTRGGTCVVWSTSRQYLYCLHKWPSFIIVVFAVNTKWIYQAAKTTGDFNPTQEDPMQQLAIVCVYQFVIQLLKMCLIFCTFGTTTTLLLSTSSTTLILFCWFKRID